jgi:hypothetical protein
MPSIANSESEREHKWWYGDGKLYALSIFSDETIKNTNVGIKMDS